MASSKQLLQAVYAACIVQFVIFFLYVNFYVGEPTKLHTAMVGLSAACGILIAGIARRELK
ncbi:MAG: hypothetical protein Q8Q08_09425 [Candidatus Omnitrophota bacterium]|nr:hypothetical protein [Candidatus Omnitrophota bacterium]MDZ4243172.1 hypothetical protein [Candidatus Omnitrophota bacterium]